MDKKIIFLAWNEFHTRNDVLSKSMNIPSYNIGRKKKTKIGSILSYFNKAVQTIRLIRKEKPAILIVTNSMLVLTMVCFLLKPFFNFRIVLDTHSSGIISSFWAYPKILRKYFNKKAFLNIVTNETHAEIIRKWGGTPFILPDPPIIIERHTYTFQPGNNNIFFINTYSDDEPYEEVIKAAQLLPNVLFSISGNNNGMNLPLLPNVIYTGFLPRHQYLQKLKEASAVLVLTTRENTFQCGGNEALSYEKPLIISQTDFLKQYFEDSCIYVHPNAQSIAEGIQLMLNNIPHYKKQIQSLLAKKTTSATKNIQTLVHILNS